MTNSYKISGGGPPPPPLSDLDILIGSIIGMKNVVLSGCSDRAEQILQLSTDKLASATPTNGSTSRYSIFMH